jgi:hypothetical protein
VEADDQPELLRIFAAGIRQDSAAVNGGAAR